MACGGTGFTIQDASECGRILDQALSTPGPVLIEAVVDPYEPPLPPKATLDQAKKLAEALAKGEPNRKKDRIDADVRQSPRTGLN